jgi:hypothetical protein
MTRSPLSRWGGVFALAALVLVGLAPRPVAAQAASSAKVLPTDVYLYFSVPSVQELKARWNKTQFSQIRQDPAFGDFVGELEKLYEQASQEFEKETKLKLDDILNLPSGEVSLAVVKPPRGQLAGVGFVDFGKSEELVDQLLAKLEEGLKQENAERKVQDFKNTRIVVYAFPKAQDLPASFKMDLAYFIKDTQFVVSNDVSALESILTNWDGNGDRSFAANKVYAQIMEKCKTGNAEPVIKWFANPIELLKAGLNLAAEGNPQVMMAMGFLPLLGLNDFRGMGGTMDMGTDGNESISKSMLYVDQPPQGLLNLFKFPATDLKPPAWVGADSQAYIAANWDVEAAYEAVETLVDTFQGAGALDRIIDDLAERPGGPGIHIKKDVLDQLNGRFYLVNHGVEKVDQAIPKMAISIGVRNAKTMQDFIAKIIKMPGVPAKTRNFRGETIIEFEAPETTVGLAVVNNSIMVCTDVALLEGVIRGDRAQQSLVDSPLYRQVVKDFPEKTSILTFSQTDDQLKVIYEALRGGQLANADLPQEAKDVLSKLPEFDAMKKYLPVSGGYTIPDENGVFSISISQAKK